jgi:hypothetical protein
MEAVLLTWTELHKLVNVNVEKNWLRIQWRRLKASLPERLVSFVKGKDRPAPSLDLRSVPEIFGLYFIQRKRFELDMGLAKVEGAGSECANEDSPYLLAAISKIVSSINYEAT